MNRRNLLKRIVAAPLALLFGVKAAADEPAVELGIAPDGVPRGWEDAAVIEATAKSPYGKVWYVCSVNGKTANDGLTPATPFPTVQWAMAKCELGKDNLIVGLPGHSEMNSEGTVSYRGGGQFSIGATT
jgi:hypothetical protein